MRRIQSILPYSLLSLLMYRRCPKRSKPRSYQTVAQDQRKINLAVELAPSPIMTSLNGAKSRTSEMKLRNMENTIIGVISILTEMAFMSPIILLITESTQGIGNIPSEMGSRPVLVVQEMIPPPSCKSSVVKVVHTFLQCHFHQFDGCCR